MDNRLKLNRNLEDQQPLGASGNFMPQTNQTCKLQEKLKSELLDQSYATLNGELTKDSKVFRCKYFGDHQNQQIIRKAALVRYMKDLPRYLERQESIQEKVLNMGVLNWDRLEKWQFRQQQMPYRISSYTQSSDRASSSSSTDESFPFSSRGLSCSPAPQKTCRPSLQFHLKASSIGAHSEAKSTCEIVERLQDIGTTQRNTLKGQEKFYCTARDSCKNNSNIKLEECKKIASIQKRDMRKGTLQNGPTNEVTSCRKTKLKTKDGELTKTKEGKEQKPCLKNSKQDVQIGSKTIVLHFPRELQKSNHSGLSHKSSTELYRQVSVEACTTGFSESSKDAFLRKGTLQNGPTNEVTSCRKAKLKTKDGELTKTKEGDGELTKTKEGKEHKPCLKNSKQDMQIGSNTIVLHLPRELQKSNHSGLSHKSSKELYRQVSVEACATDFSESSKDVCYAQPKSDGPPSCSLPCEVSNKECHLKQPRSSDAARSSTSSHSQCSKMGMTPSRIRNPHEKKSTIVPSCSHVDVSSKVLDPKSDKIVVHRRSTSPFTRFTSALGKIGKSSSPKDNLDVRMLSSIEVSGKRSSDAVASTYLDSSTNDKLNATGRRKPSPLRRLLDPILKTKAENCCHMEEPLKRGSVSTCRASKSSDVRLGSLNLSERVELGMNNSWKTTYLINSADDKKHVPSKVQALLQIAFNNGLPLLTFAVNNEREIFAATRKLSTTNKDDFGCYTFFTFREVKKKNGSWIKQEGANKGRDYINVVAQMKLSNSQLSNLLPDNQFSLREFVMFSVDMSKAYHQTSDFLPKDELSAVIVNVPAKSNLHSKHGQQNNSYYDKSQVDLKDSMHNNQNLFSTTVILPSGTHSLPSKGGPSPLIERWRSGGLCDCGGWDLGCELRIFGNRSHVCKNSSSPKSSSLGQRFELFSEGAVQENLPVLTMAPFKERIYSIEFDSSFSILQAFSTCVAVLDSSGSICGVSEATNSFAETILLQNVGTTPTQTAGTVPSYISYPPLSPVGRV